MSEVISVELGERDAALVLYEKGKIELYIPNRGEERLSFDSPTGIITGIGVLLRKSPEKLLSLIAEVLSEELRKLEEDENAVRC